MMTTESTSFGPTACGSLHQQPDPFIKGFTPAPKTAGYPDYATGPTSMLINEGPYINEIVIMNLACLPVSYDQALRQVFCNHKESFVYRKYEEFQLIEFCNCARCGKTLKHFFGFDEGIRG